MKLYHRENYLKKIRGFYHAEDIIKVVTGVRRCGKSCLMQTIADELRMSGVKDENIIFIDLDERKYRKIKDAEDLEKLIEEKENISGLKYLFIDEIQNVKGFEEVLNGFRMDGNWSIFITGSNSYLLSGELITKLTGRVKSGDSYVGEYQESNVYSTSDYTTFDNLADKRRYALGVIQEIFEKDIRLRVKIKNKQTFNLVQTFIINNFGAVTSLSKLCNSLRSSGNPVSK